MPLSSAACTPAPGRIIVIRSERPPPVFDSFDGLVPFSPAERSKPSANQAASRNGLPDSESQPTMRKRWNMFKSVFGASANTRPTNRRPDSSSGENDSNGLRGSSVPDKNTDDKSQPQQTQNEAANEQQEKPRPPYQPSSFKFTLDWTDSPPKWANKNRRLFPPCLPLATHSRLKHHRQTAASSDNDESSSSEFPSDEESDNTFRSHNYDEEKKSDNDATVQLKKGVDVDYNLDNKEEERQRDENAGSKYTGRALAEWALIVSECDGFFAYRRKDGVPLDELVETPILGVESFRK